MKLYEGTGGWGAPGVKSSLKTKTSKCYLYKIEKIIQSTYLTIVLIWTVAGDKKIHVIVPFLVYTPQYVLLR